MDKRPLCEITLNGTENMEWQGSVYFCTMGKQRRFNSLLELVRIVEEEKTSDKGGKRRICRYPGNMIF